MELPIRAGLPLRRRPGILRASATGPLVRILAALGLLAASAALHELTAPDRFPIRPGAVEVRGVGHSDPAAVRRALRLDHAPTTNIFRVDTAALGASLRVLPGVLEADVRVALPDRMVVEIREREPILVWQSGSRRFLVDVEGLLFAEVEPERLPRGLPLIVDRRPTPAAVDIGGHLDPVELDAVRRLGAVTPEIVGSRARRFDVSLQEEGFVVEARPNLWSAVFGHYTRNLRPAELVDEQVQCLRALVAERERSLVTVRLAPEGDRCGTFVARAEER